MFAQGLSSFLPCVCVTPRTEPICTEGFLASLSKSLQAQTTLCVFCSPRKMEKSATGASMRKAVRSNVKKSPRSSAVAHSPKHAESFGVVTKAKQFIEFIRSDPNSQLGSVTFYHCSCVKKMAPALSAEHKMTAGISASSQHLATPNRLQALLKSNRRLRFL